MGKFKFICYYLNKITSYYDPRVKQVVKYNIICTDLLLDLSAMPGSPIRTKSNEVCGLS